MNSFPRPDEALARRLRGMQDAVRGLLNGQATLNNQVRALAARVAALEAEEEEA